MSLPLSDRELLESIYEMLQARPITKVWVRTSEFMKLTGKTRHQMNTILRLNPQLKRKRVGEGVQINYRAYTNKYAA